VGALISSHGGEPIESGSVGSFAQRFEAAKRRRPITVLLLRVRRGSAVKALSVSSVSSDYSAPMIQLTRDQRHDVDVDQPE
jgi:hypothetical protein